MDKLNTNYDKLPGNYLFAAIGKRVAEYKSANPSAEIIRLGIGDVTRPLAQSVITAMHRATDELASAASFRGYGPEQGYDFLRDAIIRGEYAARGVELDRDEIFVSDGSKCDVANIQELFATDCTVAISDPVYPVYLDSNVMAGRTGALQPDGHFAKVVYLPATAENGFAPELPQTPVDLIYICSPNNPTGTALSRAELAKWVKYAHDTGALILYDSAYSAYISAPERPGSIYEIPGAKEVAIEFKSFSKTAGFTGVRCAFTVVPKALGKLNAMWNRRQCTKFNGVNYVVQRAAEAVYSESGMREIRETIAHYMENARIIRAGLTAAGFTAYGGVDAPYIWWKLPAGIKSFDFFERLLTRCGVVGTPGSGFGPHGEGYFRLTAFGDREQTREAVGRIVDGREKLLE